MFCMLALECLYGFGVTVEDMIIFEKGVPRQEFSLGVGDCRSPLRMTGTTWWKKKAFVSSFDIDNIIKTETEWW